MRNEASVWHWWRQVAAATLAVLAMGSSAHAADMYRIQAIPVDQTAESGVAARDLAIATGERDGLILLLKRLTAPSAHARLNGLATGPIQSYVNSFEIAQEKVGPNRYLGTLNVSYVAAAVQSLLDSAGIPYVTRRSDPILVVPIELTDGRPAAWIDNSPWRTAWYDGIDQATVTVLALPLGDLGDMAAASPEAIVAGDRAALDALASRYGTTTVFVTTASVQPAADATQPGQIAVIARRADAWNRPVLQTVVDMNPGETEQAAMGRAVGQVIAAVEDDWKTQTAGQLGSGATLPVAVPLAGLSTWVQIRRDLDDLPEVRSVTVDSFAQSEARVTIGYVGELEPLALAMERVGLTLAQESNGWLLRPAGGPAMPPYVSPATP